MRQVDVTCLHLDFQTLHNQSVRVTIAMRPDANLIRGGAEVQVDRTREQLESLGIETNVLHSLDREVGDLVHFFGPWDCHWFTAANLVKKRIPFVCSPIWSSPTTISEEKVRKVRKKVTGSYQRLLAKLFSSASAIVTLTEWEKKRLQAYFELPTQRFVSIPNGVDPRFAKATPTPFRDAFNLQEDFILHCGSIYPDKNQLGLIRAMKASGKKLVFLGSVIDPDYLAQCRREADPPTLFLDPIPADSDMLPSAYAAAKVFCLPSKFEVLSLAALEAGAAGCRLVLSDAWGAQEHFGKYAQYVKWNDLNALRTAVHEAWTKNEKPEQRNYFGDTFSWKRVAEDLAKLYEEVLISFS